MRRLHFFLHNLLRFLRQILRDWHAADLCFPITQYICIMHICVPQRNPAEYHDGYDKPDNPCFFSFFFFLLFLNLNVYLWHEELFLYPHQHADFFFFFLWPLRVFRLQPFAHLVMTRTVSKTSHSSQMCAGPIKLLAKTVWLSGHNPRVRRRFVVCWSLFLAPSHESGSEAKAAAHTAGGPISLIDLHCGGWGVGCAGSHSEPSS